MHRILARFFEVAVGALERHGGRVRQYLGDAVFATFGHPDVHEDDVRRAIEAARALLADLETLNEQLATSEGIRLQVRIGVNTGDVLIGRVIGGHEVMLGDAVNVAQRPGHDRPRRRHHARGGSEGFARRCHPHGRIGNLRRSRAHGARVRLEGHDGRRDPRPRAGAVGGTGRRAPRAPGLARARGCRSPSRGLDRAREPGIGKSRVLSAFLSELDEATTVLRAACAPVGGRDSLDPMRQLVAGIAARSPAATERLRTALSMLEPGDRANLHRRLDALTGNGPIPLEEAAWTIRRAALALAAIEPLVVAVDDIHWAPAAVLELLGELSRTSARVCLVVCARSELAVGEHGPLDGATVIDLPPLDHDQRLTLLSVPGAPTLDDERRGRIADRSRGNPPFLLELMRATAEGTTDEASVPPGILEVIGARAASLPNRAGLHERFAKWLQHDERGPLEADRLERAGLHLATAHDLLEQISLEPARARSIGTEAGRLLADAGERAVVTAADHARARSLLERVRALLPDDDPRQLSMRPWLGAAMAETGDAVRSLGYLRRTIDMSIAADEPSVEAAARFQFMVHHQYARRPEQVHESLAAIDRLVPELQRRNDHGSLGRIWLLAAVEARRQGHVADAEVHQRRAIAAARRAGNPALEATCTGGIAIVWAMGPWSNDDVLRWCDGIAGRLDASLFGYGLLLDEMPVLHAQNGDLAATEAALEAAHRFADDVRSTYLRFFAYENAWVAYGILGQPRRALEGGARRGRGQQPRPDRPRDLARAGGRGGVAGGRDR